MLVIPALYLSNGNCVSFYKGQSDQATILSRSPLKSAKEFEKQGATIIHLVDTDSHSSGSQENHIIAKNIAKNSKLQVEYSDGVTSLEDIEKLFGFGVSKVSLNQFSEKLFTVALTKYGSEKIISEIIAQRNLVEGKPGVEVLDYGREIEKKGATNIIFRDVRVEGSLHPNFDEVDRLVLGTSAHIFAFGGIGRIADLKILQKTGAYGVIISRALFEHSLYLKECIEQFS